MLDRQAIGRYEKPLQPVGVFAWHSEKEMRAALPLAGRISARSGRTSGTPAMRGCLLTEDRANGTRSCS